jgi:arylformamidase
MKKKNYLSLTHWINETTPSYGNQGGFTRSSLSAIKDGRTANSEQWGFNNHLGTHIDFPKHFDDKGLSSSDYDNPFFVYDQVGIIVLEKAVLPGHLIVLEEIVDQVKSLPVSTEILLLKTHFEEYRGQDIYWKQNPGYEEALAVLFREHFTSLKAFGFDSISLTSLNHRSMGKKAHQAFLNHQEPILIVEDMSLSKLSEKTVVQKLFISQFPVSNADGTPVNCFLSINK